jgi:hypothetical protein
MTEPFPNLLSEEEIKAIMLMSMVPGPQTEPQLKRIIEWAEKTKRESTLLSLACKSQICAFIRHADGELTFQTIENAKAHPNPLPESK